MLSSIKGKWREHVCRFAPIFFMVGAMLLAAFCGNAFAAAKGAKQKVFKSPEEAVNGLYEALKSKDPKALLAIFGQNEKDLVSSGDDIADDEMRERAVKMFE